VSDSKHAHATLGGIEFESARTVIREWVRSRLTRETVPNPRFVILSTPQPDTKLQAELASIVTDAAAATVAALFEGDPVRQRRILASVFGGRWLYWPIDDRTRMGDLVDDVRHWMAENESPLKAAMPDADLHRCCQELCEHLILGIGVRAEHDRESNHDLYRLWTRFWGKEISASPQERTAPAPGGQITNEVFGPVGTLIQAQQIHIATKLPELPEAAKGPTGPNEPQEHRLPKKPKRPTGGRLVRPVLLIAALAVVAVVPATVVDLFPRPGRGDDDTPSNEGSSRENGGDAESAAPTEQIAPIALDTVRSACAPSADSVRVEDDGKTMIIERALAEEDPGIGWDELGCISRKSRCPIPCCLGCRAPTPSAESWTMNGPASPPSGPTTAKVACT
jgi:hypothetical protein